LFKSGGCTSSQLHTVKYLEKNIAIESDGVYGVNAEARSLKKHSLYLFSSVKTRVLGQIVYYGLHTAGVEPMTSSITMETEYINV
jgi:hypothetical protein